MDFIYIYFLVIIFLYSFLLIVGIIRKKGWNNYENQKLKYYLEHNRNTLSTYAFLFKAALGKKSK